MLFLTAAGSTQPDYVALGMVLVILQYMGVGMVVIFAIISVIIGAT